MRVLFRAGTTLGVVASITSAQSGGPLLSLGSTPVAETDSLFLARPIGVAMSSRGNLYIIDLDERQVLEVDSAGRIRRAFGRSGRGPGEFESPSTMTISGDTLLAVYDRAVRRVTLIDLRTWKHQAIVPLQAGFPPSMRLVGSQLLVRSWDTEAGTSHATVDLTGAVLGREGTIPPIAKKHEILVQADWQVPFAVRGNDVVAMFELSPMLYRWTRGSRVAVAIPVPKEKRWSVTDAFFETLLQNPAPTQEFFWNRSIPLALDFVTPSIVGVVTMDMTWPGETKSVIHHLTLVDLERSRACVDLEVPATRMVVSARDPISTIALRGDQLVLLEPAPDATGEPVPTIRRFRIHPDACTAWVPLR